MQVECVRAFGTSVPGDLVEVPDGATVDPVHWRPVAAAATVPSEAVAAARAELGGLAERVIPGKEGM